MPYDAVNLYRTGDILAVGWLANSRARTDARRPSRISTSTGTSIPRMFASRPAVSAPSAARRTTPGAYTMALEEALQTAASGYTEAVTEFHIVGGLHPDLPFQYFLDLVRRAEAALPAGPYEGVHHGRGRLSSRSAPSSRFARRLQQMKAAGVDSMPGGGAEIFADRVRHIICDHKIDGDEWLDTRAHCPRSRVEVERDHALRPRRE